jgi:peptidoglycan/LPS O-acetylase OafA/YrhL
MSAAPTITEALLRPQNGFGALRLALALAVVVSHAFSVVSGRVDDEPLALSTGFTLGEHAVNGFFAISGFLVTMSFDRRGWRDYLVARTLRIVPGFVMATLVVGFGFGLAFTTLTAAAYLSDAGLWRFLSQTLTSFRANTSLPGAFAENPFRFPMGTIWTLKYEVLCYLGVIGLGLAGLLRWPRLALALLMGLVIAALAREIIAPQGGKGVETALRLPLIFMAGGVAYLFRDSLRLAPSWLALAGIFLVLLAPTPAYKPALYLFSVHLMLVAALHPLSARLLPEPRDDLSYGIYLYGWPVQQGLVSLFPKAMALALLAPAVLITAGLAFASWRLIEKPSLGLKRRILGHRASAPGV